MKHRLLTIVALTLFVAACDAPPPAPPAPPATRAAPAPAEPPAVKLPETPADVAAPPADATVTASGLAYRKLGGEPTADRHPAATDVVRVHYSGWRAEDGQLFDSSRVRGEPAEFPLDRVIPGWTEGVQLMRPGESFRFWIPGSLAYDNSSRPGAPKGMLVFDVELLAIVGKD